MTTPTPTPASLAQRAAEELASGGYVEAQAIALVSIAGSLAAMADAPTPIPEGATVLDPERVLAEFNAWLARPGNGDAQCACGHLYQNHYADLRGCGECTRWEPPSHACKGFNLDRSTR